MKNKDWKLNNKEVIIKIDDKEVRIKQYLEARKKSDILEMIKEYSFNEQILDLPKLDGIFNALLILSYTDIEYDFDHEYDLLEFYDVMESNNLVGLIIKEIPEIEYNAMVNYYKDTVSDYNRFKESFTASFIKLAEVGPALLKDLGELSKDIDMDAIRTVSEVAQKMQ